MQYTVSVDTFEGPMGLLLQLVENGSLEVTTLSVSQITNNYLARIQDIPDLNPNEMSDFLQLGCRLIYIKSLALLPESNNPTQAEELEQLNIELHEYRQFQLAASRLAKSNNGRSWQRPHVTKLALAERPLPQVDINALQLAFTEALKRTAPTQPTSIIKAHLSQESVSKRLLLKTKHTSVILKSYLDAITDRSELIITFLAILELLKTGTLRLSLLPDGLTLERGNA